MAKNKRQEGDGGTAIMEPSAPEVTEQATEPHVMVSDPAVTHDSTPPQTAWDALEQEQAIRAKRFERPVRVATTPGVIGWPVQFTNNDGTVVPASLQRRTITNPDLWDVKISIAGAQMPLIRGGVHYSPEPRPGCWNFIPGLEPSK